MQPESCQGGGTRAFPGARTAAVLRFVFLALATGTLLTNAYYLRFLEPWVSRRVAGGAVMAATFLFLGIERYGVPRTRAAFAADLRRATAPVLLAAVLLGALELRVWGARGGLPQSYVADEYDTVQATLQMLKRGDFNPRWWYYPSLHRYLSMATYLGVFWAGAASGRFESLQQVQVEDMLFAGRALSAVFGTCTVLLAFLLGRRLLGTAAGLTAAAFLAVFPGAVEHSQFNKPDALMCFLATGAVLASLVYLERGGMKWALACGALIGLTVGAKYNGALVASAFVLAALFRHGRKAFGQPELYAAGFLSLVFFFLSCPYALADFPRFVDHVQFDLRSYGFTGRPGAEGVDNWYTHFSYTLRYGAGPGATLVALLGLAMALYRLDSRWATFLVFPVLHYAHYSSQRINWADNLIPVYAFLSVLAAFAVSEAASYVARWLPRRATVVPLLRAALFAAVLFAPLARAIQLDREATLPDTGNEARAWIESALPPGTAFVVERHAPVPDTGRYKVLVESRAINQALGSYVEGGFQYLIVSSMVYERFESGHRQSQAYAKLFETTTLVKEFAPVPGRLGGPTIRILRLTTPKPEGSPARGRVPATTDSRTP